MKINTNTPRKHQQTPITKHPVMSVSLTSKLVLIQFNAIQRIIFTMIFLHHESRPHPLLALALVYLVAKIRCKQYNDVDFRYL